MNNNWVHVGLALAWVVLILGPVFLLGYAFVKSFSLPEASPPPRSDLDKAHIALITFAVLIVVASAAGCVLAATTRHTVHAWLFGILFFVSSVVDLGLYAIHQHSKPPQPTPVVTQCIPRSGGHGCPGG